MHITIDTNSLTDTDRTILAQVLGLVDGAAVVKAAAILNEDDKPTRTRRTKLEIAFDEAKAAYAADQTHENYNALYKAYTDLKVKDLENDRVLNFAQPPSPANETEDDGLSEFAEPDPIVARSLTVEEVTELATQLIRKDRDAMVGLLKQFGVRRVGEIAETDLEKFASEIRSKLA